MSICTSKQVLEMTRLILSVFQRLEDFQSAWKLLPDLLILAKVHVAVAFVF